MVSLLCFAFITVLFSECKDKDEKKITPNSTTGQLILEFSHQVDGSVLSKFPSNYYSNLAGNEYLVTTLQYYISNIELTKMDDTKIKFPIYKLVDGLSSSPQTIDLSDIPNGDYKAISYYIGIDSTRNHSGAQDGDLSPTKGMLWTWSSGYLFLKMEGFYKKNKMDESFRYHIGTDDFLNKISSPINFSINSDKKKASMIFNVALRFFVSVGKIFKASCRM